MAAVGDIVIYRSRSGVDMPAIVTAFASDDEMYAHLTLFPPPGVAADRLDPQWGAARCDDPDHELVVGSWRPRAVDP